MKSSRVLALSLSALMLGLLAAPSFAGVRGQMVNRRQDNQWERIQYGIRSGELTKQEAAKLRQNQQAIQHYERVARADGHITPQEARKIDQMQDRQNKAIFREEHDRQNRY